MEPPGVPGVRTGEPDPSMQGHTEVPGADRLGTDDMSHPPQPNTTHAIDSGAETESRLAVIRRWVLRSSIGALVLSLAVHIVLLIIASLMAVGGRGDGPGPIGPGAIEFAVMPESEFESMAADELSVEPPSTDQLLEADLGELSPAELQLDLASTLTRPDVSLDAELGSGGGDLSVDGGAAGGSAGGGGASFFGIEARGNRFAYIVDVSGSMDRDGRMIATKNELAKSITSLLDHVGFYIVLYSDDAFPLGNRREWTDATTVGKRWARGYLDRLEPLGATNPLPAFQLVSEIRPRPDAIYFMTDGEFDDRVASQIIALNRERPTPIHCITLVTADGARVMQRIAEASGGTYTHIPAGGSP